jgi:hypothetical protein
MARLKLKQVLSNLLYNATTNQLILSGSSDPSFIVSGSVYVASTPTITGSITIQNVDTFGDSGSFYTLDLGNNSF